MSCPGGTPPPVTNATADTTVGIINTVVVYTCNPGYTFVDGDTERSAYCDLYTQKWIGVPKECMSEFYQSDGYAMRGCSYYIYKIGSNSCQKTCLERNKPSFRNGQLRRLVTCNFIF